ncbi:hypothetical protein D3C75_785160 [compost metagenome]
MARLAQVRCHNRVYCCNRRGAAGRPYLHLELVDGACAGFQPEGVAGPYISRKRLSVCGPARRWGNQLELRRENILDHDVLAYGSWTVSLEGDGVIELLPNLNLRLFRGFDQSEAFNGLRFCRKA